MENARHKPRLQEPIERPNHDIHFDILRDIGGTHSFTMLYDKLLLAFHPETHAHLLASQKMFSDANVRSGWLDQRSHFSLFFLVSSS